MYKFENANVTKDFYMPSSNICPIYEFDENFEKNWVMVLGQLKYLFGNPRYLTNNLEDQFSYIIKVINENGDILQAIDYDYEGYYLDTMSKVHHRIKNGVPSWEETEMSEREFEEFDEEVWYSI